MQKEHHGIIYGILAAVVNAAMAVFVKLSADVPYTSIAFFRVAFGLIFIFPILLRRHPTLNFKSIHKHILRTLVAVGTVYLFVYSVAKLPLVNAITLFNTSPLFMPFVCLVWIQVLVPKQRIIGSIIGFLGIVIILHPVHGILNGASLAGLGAGLSAAIAYFGIRQLSKIDSTTVILAYYFFFATLITSVPAIIYWEPIYNPLSWAYLIVIGILSVIYQLFMTKAFTHGAATKVGVLTYLSVVFSGIAGWMVWKEVPNLWVILGTLFVITGGIIAVLDKKTGRPLRRG